MNGMNDNQNQLSGRVIKVLDTVSGDSKRNVGEKWYRQEFVIETFSQYPRQVCFQIWGEDRIKSANVQLGEDVTVIFELSSREYMERWYTSAEARNVMKGIVNQNMGGMMPQQGYGMPQQGYGMPQQQGYGMPQQPQQNNQMPGTGVGFGSNQGNGSDDLPF